MYLIEKKCQCLNLLTLYISSTNNFLLLQVDVPYDKEKHMKESKAQIWVKVA